VQAGVHAARKSERRRYRCLIAYRRPAGGDGGSRWPGSGSRNVGSSGGDGSLQAVLLRHYWGFWRAVVPGPVTAGAALLPSFFLWNRLCVVFPQAWAPMLTTWTSSTPSTRSDITACSVPFL